MTSPFQSLVQTLLANKLKAEQQLGEMTGISAKIRDYYNPRNQFDRWKQSTEGIAWKNKQYNRQKGRCAMCNQAIQQKGSHIDHIQPLSKFPELATDIKNLRIACAECNTAKGNKV